MTERVRFALPGEGDPNGLLFAALQSDKASVAMAHFTTHQAWMCAALNAGHSIAPGEIQQRMLETCPCRTPCYRVWRCRICSTWRRSRPSGGAAPPSLPTSLAAPGGCLCRHA